MSQTNNRSVSSLDNVKAAMDEMAELKGAKERIERRMKELDEVVRPALLGKGPVVYNGFQFQCSLVKGRKTYDTKKMAEDGLPVENYAKQGADYTRFEIKRVNTVD